MGKTIMKKSSLLIVLTVFLAHVTACSSGSEDSTLPEIRGGSSFTEVLYEMGMRKLRNDDLEDAEALFKKLRTRAGNTKYGRLALLRLGDVARLQEQWGAAITYYRQFRALEPTSTQVDNGYVDFYIGYCYWRQAPGKCCCMNLPWIGETCLFPPPEERGLDDAHRAYVIFGSVMRSKPYTEYGQKARRYYRKALRLLAGHEMYAARFYWKRDHPMGTVLRLQKLLVKYPDSDLVPEARLLMAKACFTLARHVHRHGRRPGLWTEQDYLREASRNIRILLSSDKTTSNIRRSAQALKKAVLGYLAKASSEDKKSMISGSYTTI